MNDELFRRFRNDILADLQQVSGASLEKLAKPLWDKMAGAPVQTNGLSLNGAPIAGAVDGTWPDGSISEASSDSAYFGKSQKKLRDDIKHMRDAAPHARHLRMFSTREAKAHARTREDRRKACYARLGYTLDVQAGQDLAEYIVREVLIDEVVVERIAPILPNLRRITEQYAASQRLPELDLAFDGRNDELLEIERRLAAEKCLVVSGYGGIGKTEFACAAAHRLRGQFEQVIWIDAADLERVDELGAFDVRLNGYKLNVLGILSTQSALVVLDNVTADLDLNALNKEIGPKSHVIITSQAAFGPDPLRLEEVGREAARNILSSGVAIACPDQVLDAVLAAVGGHPLVLRILNRVMIEERLTWDEVVAECRNLPGAIDERRRTVAERILVRNLPALESVLAPFVWAESSTLDASFLREVIGALGISTLKRWALLARGQSDTVRLHDIVYACACHISDQLKIAPATLVAEVKTFLLKSIDPKGLDFFRFVHRHSDLLARLVRDEPGAGIIRYAYLHGRHPKDLDVALIGDPAADAALGPTHGAREWILAVVEAIESHYRYVRDAGGKDDAKAALTQRLPVFDVLEGHPALDELSRTTVRHHRAKSMLKLGRANEAKSLFEAIVAEGPGNHPSRLQLARLLEEDPQRAKTLLFEIIEAEVAAPGTVATSTLIDTLATLRRFHLKRFTGEMTERFGIFMAQTIKAAACSGEAQPVRAFAAVGPEWSYKAPELFREVFDEIELGTPAQAEDDDERVAVGRIFVAAAKMALREGRLGDATKFFAHAILFFEAMERQNPFSSVHFADALTHIGDFRRAAKILDAVPDERREAYWRLRRSEAYLAAGDRAGLDCIEAGLNVLKDPAPIPTFLAVKADLLRMLGHPSSEAVLEEAIGRCADEQYRGDLERRLETWRSSAPL